MIGVTNWGSYPLPSIPLDVRALSLEEKFSREKGILTSEIVVTEDYRSPNELLTLSKLPSHLEGLPPGILISTGTERLFFLLLAAVEKNGTECIRGIIGRDINPKVKGYMDFAILLIRLARDLKDYNLMVGEKNVEDIRQRIESSDMSMELRCYYSAHLQECADAYWEIDQDWRQEVKEQLFAYYENPKSFAILQAYARSGNIVSTVGNLNDLTFIQEPVSAIDVSNCSDFVLIHVDRPARFIWSEFPVNAPLLSCVYHSYDLSPLSLEERGEFEDLMQKLRDEESNPCFRHSRWSHHLLKKYVKDEHLFPSDSKEVLTILRRFK